MRQFFSPGPLGPFSRPDGPRRSTGRAVLVLFVLLLALGASVSLRAHDVPGDALIQVQVKIDGPRMLVAVRAPMVSMQDIDFPQHGPGYLTIADADPTLRQAADEWVAPGITLYENDMRVEGRQLTAVMASLPSDRSFASVDTAIAHIRGPRLPDSTDIVWQQAMLDMLFEYPIQSAQSRFALAPILGRLGLRVHTVLEFAHPDGTIRAFDYRGTQGIIQLDPTRGQTASRFFGIGVDHILTGLEHALFLAVLVIPVRRLRPLGSIVIAFAVAHTVTLTAASLGFTPAVIWFPALIDTLIAVSIVWLAFENALGAAPRRRWLVAFVFGLVHGYAFSFVLRDTLQFAGPHAVLSLVAFNLGLATAQLLVVTGLAMVAWALFRVVLPARAGTILLSGLVAHTAWHWMLTRGGELWMYDLRAGLAALGQQSLSAAARWGTLLSIVLVLIWIMSRVFPRLEHGEREDGYA